MSEFVQGLRCRTTRAITHKKGVVQRSAEGTVRAVRENIGRKLVTVDFDSGEELVLFTHELEVVESVLQE